MTIKLALCFEGSFSDRPNCVAAATEEAIFKVCDVLSKEANHFPFSLAYRSVYSPQMHTTISRQKFSTKSIRICSLAVGWPYWINKS